MTAALTMPMIGYVRVSTAEQADSGHSVDAQSDAIMREADYRGWSVQWVRDTASAKDLNRSGLAYALALLSSHRAAGIVVSHLDRLSRSVLDFATLLERARREGWNLVILDLKLDLSTPYGEFGANVIMAAAQLERRLISARTKEGLAAARVKGITPGPRPCQVPDPTMNRIRDLAGKGYSLTKIANDLTRDQVPLPSGRAGVWQPTQVRRVLRKGSDSYSSPPSTPLEKSAST